MSAFSGRLNRAGYWLAFGIITLGLVVLQIVGARHAAISEVVLAILCVPRLHDIGRSGWFVLIGIAIEAAGLAIGFAFFPVAQVPAVLGAAMLVIIGLLIWLGTIPGEADANRWGEPPAPGLSFARRTDA